MADKPVDKPTHTLVVENIDPDRGTWCFCVPDAEGRPDRSKDLVLGDKRNAELWDQVREQIRDEDQLQKLREILPDPLARLTPARQQELGPVNMARMEAMAAKKPPLLRITREAP